MRHADIVEIVTPARRAPFQADVIAKLSSGAIPLVHKLIEAHYLLKRGRHADRLPWLPADLFDLVSELRRDCVARRPVHLPDGVQYSADRMVNVVGQIASPMATVRVPVEAHVADPTVFMWGLAPENLDLAESYIGLPVRYLGAAVTRERPSGSDAEMPRRWHMDVDDDRVLTIIIYLSEVDDHSGPFEYLDRGRTEQIIRTLNYRDHYMLGAAIDQIVPDMTGRRLSGPRLTAVYADTCRVLHRVKAPTTADRYSLTLQYSSMKPRRTFPENLLPPEALFELGGELTPRQRRALLID
jgi:hypothetical protein